MRETPACHLGSNQSCTITVLRDTPAVTAIREKNVVVLNQGQRKNSIPTFCVKGKRLKFNSTSVMGAKTEKCFE